MGNAFTITSTVTIKDILLGDTQNNTVFCNA